MFFNSFFLHYSFQIIEFEVNLVVMFPDKRLISWNFPIKLVRGKYLFLIFFKKKGF